MLEGIDTGPGAMDRAEKRTDEHTRTSVQDLEERVRRLERLNLALWELLRERSELSLTEGDLIAKVEEVRAWPTVLGSACPACSRTSARHAKVCLYCGAPIPITSAFDLP